jgi:hypothetical protein
MLDSRSQDIRFRLYLFVLSAIALGLVLVATSKYGAGVSSDAARNLSTADSLLQGKGLVDMVGEPLILWPPLYPLVLAGLSLVTKWSTFQSAWYLNVLLYAVNVWLAGWLLYRIFTGRTWYAAIGALIILLSRSSLKIHANVASEPLFETLMLLFFLDASAYLGDGSPRALWAMCALAALASIQRYLGVVLIGVAGMVVFSKEHARGIRRGLRAVLVSALPLAGWIVLHNLPASGTLFGPRELGAMLPLENISLSLTKILWWFAPRFAYLDWVLLRPWIPLLGTALFLIAINTKAEWRMWLKALSGPAVWPALLFSVIYFFLLAFTVVTADHLDLTSDRYYVVILPVIVALLLLTLDALVLSHLTRPRRVLLYGAIVLGALWFAYPVYSLQAYLRQAVVQGEPTNYNIANSASFREMSLVKAAQPILDQDPHAVIYSNYLNIVWFIYHHPVEALPYENASLPRAQRLIALQQNYPGWPDHSGYIIWFTPNQYHHIVAPDELVTIADLNLLFEDKTGQIYALRAHPR